MLNKFENVKLIKLFYDYLAKLCLRESLLQQKPCSTFQKGSTFSFPISTVSISNKGNEFLKKYYVKFNKPEVLFNIILVNKLEQV